MMNRNLARFAWCLGAFLLGALVALASEPVDQKIKQLDFYSLTPGTHFRLYSEKQVIEVDLGSPSEGRATVRISKDGTTFGQPRQVILLGATKGRQQGSFSLVEMGVIRTGMKLELGLTDLQSENRVHTQQLTRIELHSKN